MGRKIGKFVVGDNLVENAPDVVLQLMQPLIVIRCEHRFEDACFHYTAIGNVFDELQDGEKIPKYEVIGVQDVDGKMKFTFNRT